MDARRVIRVLTSARLSVYLIGALLVVFFLGQIIPQEALLSSREIDTWRTESPFMYGIFNFFGLFDIYRSPITVFLLTVFFVNLLFVLYARFDMTVNRCRVPEPGPVSRKNAVTVNISGATFEQVLSFLKRQPGGYRFHSKEQRFVGVRRRFGPMGVFLFHASFLIILLGGLSIFYTRSDGVVALTEGQSFNGTVQEYKTIKLPYLGPPPDIRLRINKITPSYEQGLPVDLRVEVDYLTPGNNPRDAVIRVNHPLKVGNVSVLVRNIDVAPLIKLRSEEGYAFEDAFVSLQVKNGLMDSYFFRATPYRADFEFFPDFAEEDGIPFSKSVELKNPVFKVYFYNGEKKIHEGYVHVGSDTRFNGLVLSIKEMRYWGEFRIVSERGSWLLWSGFILGTVGLVWRFLFNRTELRGEVQGNEIILSYWSGLQAKRGLDEAERVAGLIEKKFAEGKTQ